MRYGLSVMNFGDLAEARVVADLARAAEAAGWDAFLVWDHLAFTWGVPSGDPWTLVTAAALATERILVGSDVSVIARERPLPFANRLATVDRLAGGRVVLGVGIGGAEAEYRAAGEPVALRERAALTDEMLDVVYRLLAGETVTHEGPGFTVREVALAPLPLARPRIPAWIGGDSRGARRRAARWDGWIPYPFGEDGAPTMTPAELRAAVAEIHEARRVAGLGGEPFDVGVHGETPGPGQDGAALVEPWREAGATWWLESLHGYRGGTEALLARVAAGPPAG